MSSVCLLILCLGSNIYTDYFDRGNAAYASGDMTSAVAAYERLVDSGLENPEIFYNLACAYYHLDDRGRAVLNYERALGLEPDFDAAHRALDLVVAEAGDTMGRPEGFAFTGKGGQLLGIPWRLVSGAALVFWCVLWGILAFRQQRGTGRWNKAAGVAYGLLGLCVVVFLVPESTLRAAVVVGVEAQARYGPDRQDDVRMALPPGTRLVVDREDGAWARIELSDGRRGWVETRDLAYLGPPFSAASNERETQTE